MADREAEGFQQVEDDGEADRRTGSEFDEDLFDEDLDDDDEEPDEDPDYE